MKGTYFPLYLILMLVASCSNPKGLMVKKDTDGGKMLVGTASRSALMDDKAFVWFKTGYTAYKPDPQAVKLISMQASSLHVEVFGGTWCSDTHDLLPSFYKVMDAAGVKDMQINLHLVNRDKKTKDGASDKYQITNVPTFVVMIGDKQAGKIIESAKVSLEADIAAMLIDKN